MELRLRMKVLDELACYIMKRDGTDGCRVAFAAKEYAVGEKGAKLDGVIVRIVDVFFCLTTQTGWQDDSIITIVAILLPRLSQFLSRKWKSNKTF